MGRLNGGDDLPQVEEGVGVMAHRGSVGGAGVRTAGPADGEELELPLLPGVVLDAVRGGHLVCCM